MLFTKYRVLAAIFISASGHAQNLPNTNAVDSDVSGFGSEAASKQPIVVRSKRTEPTAEYLITLRASPNVKTMVEFATPFEQLPKAIDARAQPVVADLIRLGASVHTVFDGNQPAIYATLDARALSHLKAREDVESIDGASGLEGRVPLKIGGLEFVHPNQPVAKTFAKGLTDTRVLINGAIAGFGVADYKQPFLTTSSNLFADANHLPRELDYTVSFSGGVLRATRNSNNTSGARSLTLRANERNFSGLTAFGEAITNVTLDEAPVISGTKLMVPARRLMQLAGATIDWDADTRSLQTYYYDKLDVGIYFYGVQQNASLDAAGAQKLIPGQPNPFYSASRNVLIYAHGWQHNAVLEGRREGFALSAGLPNGQVQNVQNYWITASSPWNVGIFHWVQLADDDVGAPLGTPVNVERKIYDAQNGLVGMRWKKANTGFTSVGQPTANVASLYRAAYNQATSGLPSSAQVRLIGNSLGGNLTLAMARELLISNSTNPAGNRLPNRVTLQDAYWGNLSQVLSGSNRLVLPGNFASTKLVGADAAGRLFNAVARDGKLSIPLEYFTSSLAGQRGYNRAVAVRSSFTVLNPDYLSSIDIGRRHTQPTRVYLWAFAFPNRLATACLRASGIAPSFGENLASPNTCDVTVRDRMNTENYWRQDSGSGFGVGAETATPADDAYSTMSPKPSF